MRVTKPVLLALLLVGVLAVAVGCSGNSKSSAELLELDEVIRELRESFIDQELLSTEELSKAAIEGVLEYLDDPYTSYLSPDRFDSFSSSLTGLTDEFEGIGADVTIRHNQVMILGPRPDSPASRAGIRPGDVVLEVDGLNIEGYDLLEAVELIRGPKGSTVILRIQRAGGLVPIDISVVRDVIHLTNVNARIQDVGIGYVGIGTFDALTADGLRAAIADLRSEGARGLIVDLRNNTGGLVDSAVAVVSEFVEDGLVFIERTNEGEENEHEVLGDGSAYDLPLVVLVNSFSASASEIVSGSLQDHDRATIVGTRTFGKGSVNLLTPLDSGSGLYVTIGRWLTPTGRLIEGEGLEPDVAVGSAVDVQGSQRVGQLSRSLCDAYDEDIDALGGQDELVAALEGLCSLRQSDAPIPDGDEQLAVAVTELRKLMDG